MSASRETGGPRLDPDADRLEALIARTFPDCAPEVRTGDVDRERAIEIMRIATERYYPECAYAFGHGSALTGGFKPYSDLDVIVFLREADHWEIRKEMVNGFLVEFTSFTIDALDLMGMLSFYIRLPLGFVAADGEIVVDKDGGARAFQDGLRAMRDNFHAVDQSDAIDRTREQLFTMLLEFGKNRTPEVMRAVALTGYPVILSGITLLERFWNHRSKHLAKHTELPGSARIAELHEAIAELMRGEIGPIIRFVEELLNDLGGPLWHGRVVRQTVKPEYAPVVHMLLNMANTE